MTERFPDIEIYLLKPSSDSVRAWLVEALSQPLNDIRIVPGHCHWQTVINGKTVDIYLNENAEKNFTSLWIKQNHTPWNTDLDCGRAAHTALECEIRCSDSGWQESDNASSQEGGWIKLIRGEEKPLSW